MAGHLHQLFIDSRNFYTFSYYVRTNDTTVGYNITVGVGTSQTSTGMTTTLSTVTGYQTLLGH